MAADIQDALPYGDALGNRDVVGAGIDRKSGLDGRAALAGGHPDHAAAQVAVFGRRDAGNDLHGLDVLYLQAAGIHAGEATERGVVAHADAVHFHRRAEGGVAGAGPAPADGQFRRGRQVRIDGLAAGHQGRDVGQAGHLQVLQGRPLDPAGGIEVLLGLFGRHHDLVQGQRLFLQDDDEVIDRLAHAKGPDIGREAQAFRFHPVGAGLDGSQDETALGVRDGPQVVFVQVHDRPGERLPLCVRHAPAYAKTGRERRSAYEKQHPYGQNPSHRIRKDTQNSRPLQSPFLGRNRRRELEWTFGGPTGSAAGSSGRPSCR